MAEEKQQLDSRAHLGDGDGAAAEAGAKRETRRFPGELPAPAQPDPPGTARLGCMNCHKSVSTPVPSDVVVRAAIQCPECLEKQANEADPAYRSLFLATAAFLLESRMAQNVSYATRRQLEAAVDRARSAS